MTERKSKNVIYQFKMTLKKIEMNIQIQNTNINDIDQIFHLYKITTDFQKTKFTVH